MNENSASTESVVGAKTQDGGTHTPGPWFVSGKHVPVSLDDYPDQRVLFDSVEAVGYEAGGGIALVHCKPGYGNPNAKLIAAAPELLEALRPIAAAYPNDPGTSDLDNEQPVTITLGDVRRVWAVLAKLKGTSCS